MDCLAAKHNPANACTGECKWLNACGAARVDTIAPAPTPEFGSAVETIEEEPKKKPGRPKKGE